MRIRNVVFMGSSAFALPPLEALLEMGFKPLIITRPDAPAGRGKKPRPTPVKDWGIARGLSVWEPEALAGEEFFGKLSDEKPDLIVSAAYGRHIPARVLSLPDFGSINLHPSLLPRWRGAAPVQRAILAGETETGITLAFMAEKWDSGDILLQESFPVSPADDAGTLLDKLAREGALLLKGGIPLLADGKLSGIPQDDAKATFAPKLKEEEGWVDWSNSSDVIVNQVRAFSPEPGASTHFEKGRVKIFKASPADTASSNPPGTVMQITKEGPVVACGEGSVLLMNIQPENRKILSGKDFVNGYRVQAGQLFHA